MKRALKLMKRALLFALCAPLAFPLILLWIIFMALFAPIGLCIVVWQKISSWRYRRRNANKLVLVCSSKHNWHDFLVNNLIPILPDECEVVWQRSERDGDRRPILNHLVNAHINSPKPYLIRVTRERFLHQPLNAKLQELKAHPEISEATRKTCSEIVDRAIEKLQKKP